MSPGLVGRHTSLKFHDKLMSDAFSSGRKPSAASIWSLIASITHGITSSLLTVAATACGIFIITI